MLSWLVSRETSARLVHGVVLDPARAKPNLSQIRAVVFDFDGMMTDDTTTIDSLGIESAGVNRSHGTGTPLLVLSTETDPVFGRPCWRRRLEGRQGINDKEPELRTWLSINEQSAKQLLSVGNGINQLVCMRLAHVAIAPASAHAGALAAADIVFSLPGGRGAARDLANLIPRELRTNPTATAPNAGDPSE